MKITVDRTENGAESLIFTVTVSNPSCIAFTAQDMQALETMDQFIKIMGQSIDPNGEVFRRFIAANHNVKEKILEKILAKLRFHIEAILKKKFNPMCEEIYNWLYDHQEGHVKNWLSSYSPERTKYYFDNDKNTPSINDEAFDDEDSQDD